MVICTGVDQRERECAGGREDAWVCVRVGVFVCVVYVAVHVAHVYVH